MLTFCLLRKSLCNTIKSSVILCNGKINSANLSGGQTVDQYGCENCLTAGDTLNQKFQP